MSAISTDPIERFSVMHCVFAPAGFETNSRIAEQAYYRFTEQSAVRAVSSAGDSNPSARMVIIDSSEKPTEALKFFQNLQDNRVTYMHIPNRPGRPGPSEELQAEFPKAYSWMREHADLYKLTIPSDEGLGKKLTYYDDVDGILKKYDAEAYKKIMRFSVLGSFKDAVVEFTKHAHEIHDRPHLGSARNFAIAVAARQGSQAVIYKDDDLYGPDYVKRHLAALKNADFTALTQYPSLIYTEDMAKKGAAPIWAVTDLNRGGQGMAINWEGQYKKIDNVPEALPMGFTYATRIPKLEDRDLHPRVPHILGGEDRGYLERLVRGNYRINIQNEPSPDIVRLVFGISSSMNYVHEVLSPGDAKMPNPYMQRATAQHLAAIHPPLAPYANNIVQSHPQAQPEEASRDRVRAPVPVHGFGFASSS